MVKYWVIGILLFSTLIVRIVFSTKPDSLTVKNKIEKPQYTGRIFFLHKINGWLMGNNGELASGIMFGGGENLSFELKTSFRKVGLSHILAASGYNVIVFSGWLSILGTKLGGRKVGILFGIFCTIVYMYLAGFTIPVVRAGAMFCLVSLGSLWGRKSDKWWSLYIVSWVMLVLRPDWFWEISWQLSFAATVAVMLVSTNIVSSKGWKDALISDLKVSVSAWALTMPIIIYHFGQISLISPFVNLLVLWTIPMIMQVLSLAVFVGLFWDGLGYVISLVSWPLIEYLKQVVTLVSKGNLGYIDIGTTDIWFVIVYYAVIGVWIILSG